MSSFKLIYNLVIAIILIVNYSFAQNKTTHEENCLITNSKDLKQNKIKMTQLNVLGTELKLASLDPLTGFYRNGYCSTDANDRGVHVIAAVVTEEFLNYSLSKGNDLISAYPANGFPGLKPGDVWCLCALRWKEALNAGVAPPVLLEATNSKALEFVTLEELKSKKIEN
jgi:uncharacterized protein